MIAIITAWIASITTAVLVVQRLIECINQLVNTQEAKNLWEAIKQILVNFRTTETYSK